jgi:hypothetical protein
MVGAPGASRRHIVVLLAVAAANSHQRSPWSACGTILDVWMGQLFRARTKEPICIRWATQRRTVQARLFCRSLLDFHVCAEKLTAKRSPAKVATLLVLGLCMAANEPSASGEEAVVFYRFPSVWPFHFPEGCAESKPEATLRLWRLVTAIPPTREDPEMQSAMENNKYKDAEDCIRASLSCFDEKGLARLIARIQIQSTFGYRLVVCDLAGC